MFPSNMTIRQFTLLNTAIEQPLRFSSSNLRSGKMLGIGMLLDCYKRKCCCRIFSTKRGLTTASSNIYTCIGFFKMFQSYYFGDNGNVVVCIFQMLYSLTFSCTLCKSISLCFEGCIAFQK